MSSSRTLTELEMLWKLPEASVMPVADTSEIVTVRLTVSSGRKPHTSPDLSSSRVPRSPVRTEDSSSAGS